MAGLKSALPSGNRDALDNNIFQWHGNGDDDGVSERTLTENTCAQAGSLTLEHRGGQAAMLPRRDRSQGLRLVPRGVFNDEAALLFSLLEYLFSNKSRTRGRRRGRPLSCCGRVSKGRAIIKQ